MHDDVGNWNTEMTNWLHKEKNALEEIFYTFHHLRRFQSKKSCINLLMALHFHVLYVGSFLSQMCNIFSVYEFYDLVFDDTLSTKGFQKYNFLVGGNQTYWVIMRDLCWVTRDQVLQVSAGGIIFKARKSKFPTHPTYAQIVTEECVAVERSNIASNSSRMLWESEEESIVQSPVSYLQVYSDESQMFLWFSTYIFNFLPITLFSFSENLRT